MLCLLCAPSKSQSLFSGACPLSQPHRSGRGSIRTITQYKCIWASGCIKSYCWQLSGRMNDTGSFVFLYALLSIVGTWLSAVGQSEEKVRMMEVFSVIYDGVVSHLLYRFQNSQVRRPIRRRATFYDDPMVIDPLERLGSFGGELGGLGRRSCHWYPCRFFVGGEQGQ